MSAKILIVDDQYSNRFMLSAILKKDFYTTVEACDGFEAIEVASREMPDLILMDVEMPRKNGIEACLELKKNPQTRHIPIIIVTAKDSQVACIEGLTSGADDYLVKPIDARILFARVRNLLRVKALLDELQLRHQTAENFGASVVNPFLSHTENVRILLVTRTKLTSRQVKTYLTNASHCSVTITHNETQALDLASDHDYDAFIIYENLEEGGLGLRLIAKLRAEWKNRNKVILFASQSGGDTSLRSLELGANDYLTIPFDDQELHVRLKTQLTKMCYANALRGEVESQLKLAVMDPLTDLHNRRYFDEYLPRIIERSRASNRTFALMTLDLDKFKSINDEYGHEFGDTVLIETARRLRKNLRAMDLIVRYGGEEFVIVTPKVDIRLAQQISERLRHCIEAVPFETRDKQLVKVTTSIGVSFEEPGKLEIDEILRASDMALYRAKSLGRNQVVFAA